MNTLARKIGALRDYLFETEAAFIRRFQREEEKRERLDGTSRNEFYSTLYDTEKRKERRLARPILRPVQTLIER